MDAVMPGLQEFPGRMHPTPGIAGIEDPHVLRIFERIELRKPEQWPDRIQGSTGLCPEVGRREHGHIATESVDPALVDPPSHAVDHLFSERYISIVKVDHIIPAMGIIKFAGFVSLIEIRPGNGPMVITSRMIGDPVDDHAHAQPVGFFYQLVKVAQRAEFGIDGAVVRRGIVTTQGSLSALNGNGGDGHEPQDVHSHIGQAGKMTGEGAETAFRRVLTGIHFIHRDAAGMMREGVS